MQFGMPTLIELESLDSCATLCRELGLDFIELNMNLPEYQVDRLDVERLLQIAEEYSTYYTIHFDENLNPCDFNDKVAMAYTETVLQTIEIAKQLSVPVLNMHMNSGVWFTLPDKKVFLFEKYGQEYMWKLNAFRDACTEAIGDANIKICVENCGDFGNKAYIKNGLSLLLNSTVFSLTFDIGHNANAGFTDESVIMERINRLNHMHIHDALPEAKSDHLTLGEGELNLAKYLYLAKKYNCQAVLEVKTVEGLRHSVDWLKERDYI
jgi:sugar phosphate isomerase/epimerase